MGTANLRYIITSEPYGESKGLGSIHTYDQVAHYKCDHNEGMSTRNEI